MYRFLKTSHVSALHAVMLATFLTSCYASQEVGQTEAVIQSDGNDTKVMAAKTLKTADTKASDIAIDSGPDLDFYGTISGEKLDLLDDGITKETPALKQFRKTGINPYNKVQQKIDNGYTIYSTACSGCHGHLAEGKLGPALADSYWTYPENKTDKGLFATIYGGANGMMGPQKGLLDQDEILQIMSWLKSLQEKDSSKAH